VVEIDPEITRVSLTYLGVPKTTKIRTFNTDGRWFVMTHKEKESYDFIFMDAFNDLSIPYHLTTQEFSLQLKGLLKPDGLFIANIIDNFTKGAFLPSYTRTLEQVFGEGKVHLLTLSPSEEYIGLINTIVVASPRSLDMDDLVKAVKTSGMGEMLSHVMPQDRLRQYLKERSPVILTDDYVPVDNLIAPAFEEAYGN
jgi:spermidine synthase